MAADLNRAIVLAGDALDLCRPETLDKELPVLPPSLELDPGGSGPKHLSDQGGQGSEVASFRPGEDASQSLALLLGGALVQVEGDLPVPVLHVPIDMGEHGDAQVVEEGLNVVAVFDVSAQED